ncbi:hypothetical protein [Streptomyces antarcticus]|uniref:hypothetical protein n=1 Tax=Streptomyces antarcticus TaxID=2996458 RepID=UPI00226E0DCD|nr:MULTISPECIES: hypothetical protein [unclassified Streptomyces]MCY0941583.1 hypothetical protein [Streptomyces sp. H34-AA3]MCY0953881.1 hypothetical protein [Streptomyces sp. H27-S2]MCZ4081789.1 hypothetical protein [Streptomyces sp. H34-S5]
MIVTAPSSAPAAEKRAPRRPSGGLRRTFALSLAEGAVSLASAALLLWLCLRIRINPMDRIGQVSGLAGIQLRLMVMMALTVLLYLLVSRWKPGAATRFGAAAVAGLATAVIAAGNVVSLRGTAWPIYANWGDVGNLQQWAYDVIDGVALPAMYPPGFPHLLAWTSELFFDGDMGKATKWVMIGFLALSGPAVYMAWRMLLPPLWALGIGVTATLPVIDPYKPYSALVLAVVIPVFAKMCDVVLHSTELGRRRSAATGAGLGLLLAVMFLLYSGWFLWSSVGVVVLFAMVLAGLARSGGIRGLVDGLVPLASALAVFLALAGTYLVRLLGSGATTKDAYFYFDTWVDPAYFTMWASGTPGPLRSLGWPPPGELAGVGLFTLVLVAGLGVALTLGLRQPMVLTLAACTASAFLLRYWYAAHMERDQAVQLYPRTSHQLMYCLIALTGLALYYAGKRVRVWLRLHEAALRGGARRTAASRRPRAGVVGALCALGLLFGLAGSATVNAYMPQDPGLNSSGQFAWFSHNIRQADGQCPRYAVKGECSPYVPPLRGPYRPPAVQKPFERLTPPPALSVTPK